MHITTKATDLAARYAAALTACVQQSFLAPSRVVTCEPPVGCPAQHPWLILATPASNLLASVFQCRVGCNCDAGVLGRWRDAMATSMQDELHFSDALSYNY